MIENQLVKTGVNVEMRGNSAGVVSHIQFAWVGQSTALAASSRIVHLRIPEHTENWVTVDSLPQPITPITYFSVHHMCLPIRILSNQSFLPIRFFTSSTTHCLMYKTLFSTLFPYSIFMQYLHLYDAKPCFRPHIALSRCNR